MAGMATAILTNVFSVHFEYLQALELVSYVR
jgi:hypothetical protein